MSALAKTLVQQHGTLRWASGGPRALVHGAYLPTLLCSWPFPYGSNIIKAYALLKLPSSFPGLSGFTQPTYALVLELMEVSIVPSEDP